MPLYQDIRSWVRRTGAPVTVVYLAVSISLMIYGWLLRGQAEPLMYSLSMDSHWYSQPWSLITYPFAGWSIGPGLGILWFLCGVMWFFFVSSTVERDLGKNQYITFSLAMTAIGGLCVWMVSRFTGISIVVTGPVIPFGAITVAWATRYPLMIIMIFGLIPIQARWLGVMAALGVLLSYGSLMPALGIAASVPIALAFLYASNRLGRLRYGSSQAYRVPTVNRKAAKAADLQDERYFQDVREREKARAERERLRKLFESSLDDEGKGSA